MRPLLHDDLVSAHWRLPASPAANDRVRAKALAASIQPLIEDLREQIALLDEQCEILVINRAWRDTVETRGFRGLPGDNYRLFCAGMAAQGYDPAIQATVALDQIVSGRRSFWKLVYNGGQVWGGREFEICQRRIAIGGIPFILVTRFDLTELLQLRREKEDFTKAVTAGQADARQRLGRELHDGTSQVLTAIGLFLGRLKQEAHGAGSMAMIEELQGLLAEAQQEIRAISYLAHPPAVDKLGLPGAMKLLVEGFALRAGLDASFEIQGDYSRLPPPSKAAIYRVAQEALSNVHRHARARRVRLILVCRPLMTHFIVADDGVGIPAPARAGARGVGLSSMRARLAEIGGRTTILDLSPGTAIVASVPSPPRAEEERPVEIKAA